jgi:hypothetical protein
MVRRLTTVAQIFVFYFCFDGGVMDEPHPEHQIVLNLLREQYDIFEQYINSRQHVVNLYFLRGSGTTINNDNLESSYDEFRRATRRLHVHLLQWKLRQSISTESSTDRLFPSSAVFHQRSRRRARCAAVFGEVRRQLDDEGMLERREMPHDFDSRYLRRLMLDHIDRTFRVVNTIVSVSTSSSGHNILVPFSSSGIPLAVRSERVSVRQRRPLRHGLNGSSEDGSGVDETGEERTGDTSDDENSVPFKKRNTMQHNEQQSSIIVALAVLRASIQQLEEEVRQWVAS